MTPGYLGAPTLERIDRCVLLAELTLGFMNVIAVLYSLEELKHGWFDFEPS